MGGFAEFPTRVAEVIASGLPIPSPPPTPQQPGPYIGATDIRQYGVVPNAAGNQSALIQQALNDLAAGLSTTLYFPAGVYKVASQLTLTSAIRASIVGPSCGFPDGAHQKGANIEWIGAPGTGNLFVMDSCFACEVRGIQFVGFAQHLVVISNTTPVPVVSTNNRFVDCAFVGASLADYDTAGVQIPGATDNNESHTFERCYFNLSATGLLINNQQSHAIRVLACDFGGHRNNCISLQNGSFTAIGCSFGYSGQKASPVDGDILLSGATDTILISGCYFEGSVRMLAVANTTGYQPIVVNCCMVNEGSNLADNGQLISALAPGPYTFIGCEFSQNASSRFLFYLGFDPAGRAVFIACDMPNATPFQVPSIVSGQLKVIACGYGVGQSFDDSLGAGVALGGGAAPTLGTIGGSGPATAAQAGWRELADPETGAKFWVPYWR